MGKTRLLIFSQILVAVLLCPGHSAAGDCDYDFEVFGEWRYIYSHAQDFPLNVDGDVSGLNWYLDHRLDIGTRQYIGDFFEFDLEFEVFYGQVAGDFDHLAAEFRQDTRQTLRGWDLAEFDLRQAWVRLDLPWFQVRLGHMYSNWGLGLLANDGRSTPGRFGYQDKGDISERVILATRPLFMVDNWASDIVLALGAGVVYHDENCDLRNGDVGIELIGSIFYHDDGLDFGMYVAGRMQEDDAGTRLDATAVDFFGKIDAGPGFEGLLLAAEFAILTGSTDRVIQADRLEGLDISAFGAAFRGGWRFGFFDFLPVLELGYASGDADPHDNTITSFSFDPDYKVGLVLFDTVMRHVTAMGAKESADPDRIGQPLPGTDQLASKGRVSGAFYLYPSVSMRPLPEMTVMAGFLFAFSAVPFSQSFRTFENGGVPTNPYGLENPGRYLGWELNLGVDWDQKIWQGLHVVGGFQAGWFFPGSAFDRPDGTRPGIVSRFLARVALTY